MPNKNKDIAALPAAVTPRKFIESLFHVELAGGFPVFTKTPSEDSGTAQVTGQASAFAQILDGEPSKYWPDSWHFCTSYTRRVDGVAKRRKQDLVSIAVLVLDDVGTKVKERYLNGMPLPSYKLETSAGNFQWGYILEEPDPDLGKFEAIMRILAERGMTDGGSIDAAHVFRLPGSIKAGGEFVARLTHWTPQARFTLDGLAWSAAIDLFVSSIYLRYQIRQPSELERGRRDDAIYEWLLGRGMVYGQKNQQGYMLIECPWSSEHTPGAGMTADYLPFGLADKNGDRYFHCHHNACKARHTPDFLQWCDGEGAPKPEYVEAELTPELVLFRDTLLASIAEMKAPSPDEGMPIQTMSELRAAAAKMPDPETVLGPFQTGTWGILAALPGVGKSMFISAIMRAVSLALPLGDYAAPARMHSVGVVDAEMSEKEIHERMPMDTPDTVHWITTDLLERHDHIPFSLGNRSHQAALIEQCERLNLRMIFIDNIEYTLEPAPGKDVWHPETWRQVIPLIRWAKRTGRVLVFIDHLNAQGGVQGSLAKQRGASFVMKLEADYEEHAVMCFRAKFIKIRYMVSNNLKANRKWWLEDSGEWRCEREMSKHDQVAQLLVEGVAQKDIALEVGLSKGQISKLARKFKAQSEEGRALAASERDYWKKRSPTGETE